MKTMKKSTDQITTQSIRDQIFPRNEQGNIVLRHVLIEALLKSRLTSDTNELEHVLNEAERKVISAMRVQETLLTERQVSERWKFLDVSKLRNYRYRGVGGPKFLKFGTHRNSRVYYKVSDIEAWIVEAYELHPLLRK